MLADRAGGGFMLWRGSSPGLPSRGWSSLETHDRRAPPPSFRTRVRVGGDQRVAGEQRLDDRALDAPTPAVDQPHLGEAPRVAGLAQLPDAARDVPRRQRAQVAAVL